MTPKEKAQKLVDEYKLMFLQDFSDTDIAHEILCTYISKQCALIAVREIIKEPAYCDSGSTYYQEVEQEIEKL